MNGFIKTLFRRNIAMIDPQTYFDAGLTLHGHKCPAMPMGLRAGAAAMNALQVERAPDGQLVALVELGDNHCATCFADGIQMITGCTFGKGNIQKLHYGKWGVTLIDKKTRRSVRVAPKAEVMESSKHSPFIQEYREQGIPASQVPPEVSEPLVEHVMTTPTEDLLSVGPVQDCTWQEHPHSFDAFVCQRCGEMTVEPYGRLLGDQKVCIPCRVEATGWGA
jgi:formylmethanofuran dehydrogenase subunit E